MSAYSGKMSAMPCSERQQRVVALLGDRVCGELRLTGPTDLGAASRPLTGGHREQVPGAS